MIFICACHRVEGFFYDSYSLLLKQCFGINEKAILLTWFTWKNYFFCFGSSEKAILRKGKISNDFGINEILNTKESFQIFSLGLNMLFFIFRGVHLARFFLRHSNGHIWYRMCTNMSIFVLCMGLYGSIWDYIYLKQNHIWSYMEVYVISYLRKELMYGH